MSVKTSLLYMLNRSVFTIVILFIINGYCLGQQKSLENIIQAPLTFDQIVKECDQYFDQKHPGLSTKQLSSGEYRDGEYVKYERWKHYWKNSLNPDGTLGDISLYAKEKFKRRNQAKNNGEGVFSDIEWSNISHQNYKSVQIGMGRTTSIAFHPTDKNIFYVGSALGGVWKTTDGGLTYEALGDDLPMLYISNIIVDKEDPNIIYISLSDHVWYGHPGSLGVYKSIDGGLTWNPTALELDITDFNRIYAMEAVPGQSNKIFVAADRGLYLTEDGFETYRRVTSIPSRDVRIHPHNNDIVYLGTINGEFQRSLDGGNTFSVVQDFGNSQVFLAVASNKVFARHESSLYRSFDSGASFTAPTNFLENNEVFVFAPNNENILITGNFESSRSDNGGELFYKTSQWLGNNGLPLMHVDQRNIRTNPLEENAIYYCNDGGIYRYNIDTNSFDNLCDGLIITQYYDIAVSQTDENVIGGGSQDNGNLYRDSNGDWFYYAPTGDGMVQAIDKNDAGVRYWTYQLGALNRWENGFNINVSPPGKSGNGAWITPYRLDPNNQRRIISGYDRVYESTNRGDSWREISGQLAGGDNLEHIAIAPTNGNRIYAAHRNRLYVKDTLENSWTSKPLPWSISDLEVSPVDMNTIFITIPGFTVGDKVFVSHDAGDTWNNISYNLPNIPILSLELYEDREGGMFIGTDSGVYYKDDSVESWFEYGQLPHTRVDDVEIQYSAQKIRIGTHGRGVFEADIKVEFCNENSLDSDNDGVCDLIDQCPLFDDSLLGTACDDGDEDTIDDIYTNECLCMGSYQYLTYCEAEGAAGTGADWINRVELNTLTNVSSQSNYSNFTHLNTTLETGYSYTLSVSLNFSFALDTAMAWIDYDKNGFFDDYELIEMSDFDNAHTSTAEFSLPPNFEGGPTTLRVRVIFGDNNSDDPCGSYFGEVEDYGIILRDDSLQSIAEIDNDNSVSLYPNPVKDELNIALADASEWIESIELISTQGKLLRKYDNQNSSTSVINLSEVDESSILYLVVQISGGKRIVKRVVKL